MIFYDFYTYKMYSMWKNCIGKYLFLRFILYMRQYYVSVAVLIFSFIHFNLLPAFMQNLYVKCYFVPSSTFIRNRSGFSIKSKVAVRKVIFSLKCLIWSEWILQNKYINNISSNNNKKTQRFSSKSHLFFTWFAISILNELVFFFENLLIVHYTWVAMQLKIIIKLIARIKFEVLNK